MGRSPPSVFLGVRGMATRASCAGVTPESSMHSQMEQNTARARVAQEAEVAGVETVRGRKRCAW